MDDDDYETPTCFSWMMIFRRSVTRSEVLTAKSGFASSNGKTEATPVVKKHTTLKGSVQYDNLMFSDEKTPPKRRDSHSNSSKELDRERSQSKAEEPALSIFERDRIMNQSSPTRIAESAHRRNDSNSLVVYQDSADLSGGSSNPPIRISESNQSGQRRPSLSANSPSSSSFESPSKKEKEKESVLKRLSMAFVKPLLPGAVRIRSSPEYSSNTPMESNKAMSDESELRVLLRPHQHSRQCDRSERVCTAIGKWREGETVHVTGLFNHPSYSDNYLPLEGIFWLRSLPPHDAQISEFQPISGSGNQIEYKLTSQDVNCLISFTCRWVVNGNSILSNVGDIITKFAVTPMGPIEPSPPKITNLRVAGDTRVGCTVRAEGEYTGGTEGNSSYWWIRITPAGERVNITEPAEANDGVNPKLYVCSPDDVGSTLKVKCRPVRSDGDRGEVITSKASTVITR